jgi:hypothetical protein
MGDGQHQRQRDHGAHEGRGDAEKSAPTPGRTNLVETSPEATAAPASGFGQGIPWANGSAQASEAPSGPGGHVHSMGGTGRATVVSGTDGADRQGASASAARTSSEPGPKIRSKTVLRAAKGASSRTTVGVGEVVRMTTTSAGMWLASGGTRSSNGRTRAFDWTAPGKPGTFTITLVVGGKNVKKKFKVVAPSSLKFKLKSEDTYPAGQQGVGMYTDLTVGPTSVSFGNVEWLEVPGPPTNIHGYFKNYPGLYHHPNPSWLRWNEKNTSIWDHANLFRWPKPWSPGGFTWAIPNKWRVAAEGGDGHVFQTVNQVFTMHDNKGTTSVSKGGVTVTRTP